MDKEFWLELRKNKYEIPTEHTLSELTSEIFSYLGSTDPELRDEIGYTTFANWLNQGRYPVEELRSYIKELLINLHIEIGETESDSVFLRAFSILFLAEIVHNDNKKTFLDKSDIERILEESLWYISTEKDPRGYIPVTGWAHALAHTADLLLTLGCNRNLEELDLWHILNSISEKMFSAKNYIYIHNEDERLASAVVEVLRRGLLPIEKIEAWAKSFTEKNWKGAFANEEQNRAFQNTRNLLRSIYLELEKDEEEMSRRDEYKKIFLETIKIFKS